MAEPTRYEKTVIVGLPTILAASLLVRLFTHGAVSRVALGVYLGTAVVMLGWLWRHESGRGPSRRERRERAILSVLAEHPEGLYGLDLHKALRFGPGLLFPALKRLEQQGRVRAFWVNTWPAEPRRRYYALASDAAEGEAQS
jgi:hypothetical protein